MSSFKVFEFDDMGANHEISDMCQSHDCRDVLLKLKEINPKFKVTLFAIPGEMTQELLEWSAKNRDWVELAVHGVFHSSNYECEKMSYDTFDRWMMGVEFRRMLNKYFVKGFRAPGWQISDDIYRWLSVNDWWVADQGYNDDRRPAYLDAYVHYDGKFRVLPKVGNPRDVDAHHGHVWNCVGNGIYEQFDYLADLVRNTEDFKFVSESFV